MTYKEYLQSDTWKEKRKLKLSESGNSCQLCNSQINLHIHHRTYERIFKENLNDLTVLCQICHSRFHETINEILDREIKEFKTMLKNAESKIGFCKHFGFPDSEIKKLNDLIALVNPHLKELEELRSKL